jgi:AhpD family alkylhydroperoxidase
MGRVSELRASTQVERALVKLVDRGLKLRVTNAEDLLLMEETEEEVFMARLPKAYESFKKTYPEVWQAYDRLGGLIHDSGPLDKKNRELLKLAISFGARLEGAVHSHTRRALEQGATAEEIYHVVLLGLTTLGFPQTIAACTWVEDDLKDGKRRESKGRKR